LANNAQRGFDKSCLFLLGGPYDNLYEKLDREELTFRCKGCQATVKRAQRKAHFDKHLLDEVMPDRTQEQERLAAQIADEQSRLLDRIEVHEHKAQVAAEKHGRARRKVELLVKKDRSLNAKEQALVAEADALLKEATSQQEAAQRLRFQVEELSQPEEADRRLARTVRKRVGTTRRRSRVPRARSTSGRKTRARKSTSAARADLSKVARGTISKILRLFDGGMGGASIARQLNKEGNTPPGGSVWRRQLVNTLISNERGGKDISSLRKKSPVRRADNAANGRKRKTAAKKAGTGRKRKTSNAKKSGTSRKASSNARTMRGGKKTYAADPKPKTSSGGRKRAGGRKRGPRKR
jgi:hypothetical protein